MKKRLYLPDVVQDGIARSAKECWLCEFFHNKTKFTKADRRPYLLEKYVQEDEEHLRQIFAAFGLKMVYE
ncbi:MAG: hypothetical protein WC976_06080 [Caldisericia bacterium]